MTVNYLKTRYAVREEWDKYQFDKKTEEKLKEGRLSGTEYFRPPGPASENVAESLDLSHYLHTTIFTSIENGWHYAKSISYDAMMIRRKENKWERAEEEGIKYPGRSRDHKFFINDRKRREKEARYKRMQERSGDEEAMENLREKRNRKRREEDEGCGVIYSVDPVTDKVLTGRKPGVKEVGLTSGPLPLRPNIRGERLKAAPPVDESEEKIHWTDLIGFPFKTKFACFYINGEPHIVVPQMLAELHMGYGHAPKRFGYVWEKLGIREKTASGGQVRALKKERIINGVSLRGRDVVIRLMRKSDASRILGEYLPLEEDENENPKLAHITQKMEEEAVMVEHECQGFASGRMFENGYVRCDECNKFYKPDSFVCHSHRRTETQKVLHWGYTPRRWRDYLNLYGKDRNDPEAIKRFNQIISEPIPAEFREKETKGSRVSEGSFSSRRSILATLNKSFNRRPPSPFVVGAESTGRLPQRRKSDEDEEVEEEETVHEKLPEPKTIEVIDDDIQIIKSSQKSKEFGKDEYLFKAPDPFATPLSRKYAEKAGKTKAFDLDEFLPAKLPSIEHPWASLLHQQPISVYATSITSNPNGFLPITNFFDDFISASKKGDKLDDEQEKPLKSSKEVESPPSELSPLPSTSTAVVPYQKEKHAVVASPSSPSAFLPLHIFVQQDQIKRKYHDREVMARQLDDELMGLLELVPTSMANRIAEVVQNRDKLRDANIVDMKTELMTAKAEKIHLEKAVYRATYESECLYKICKEKDLEISHIPQPNPSVPQFAPIVPPILKQFSLPPSSQPLSILPPPASSAPPSSSHPFQLNGGRSLSLNSSIGIHRVSSSMFGQPGPSFNPIPPSSSAAVRPVQQPQRAVGQRGRPRGSTNAYLRKQQTNNAASQAAEVANIQRQIEQQKMQQQQQNMQLQLRALQQMQQQQQQQVFSAAQASPLGLLNGGNINGSPSASNPFSSFGSMPVSLSSLLSTSLPSSSQTDFTGMGTTDALIARMQMNSSSSSACPSIPSTPSNGIPPTTPTQEVNGLNLHDGPLTPEKIQMILMQGISNEQQRHQQLLQPSPVSSAPLPPQQPSPAAPAAGTPMIDMDFLRGVLANPTMIPEGVTMEQIRSCHDSIALITDNRLL